MGMDYYIDNKKGYDSEDIFPMILSYIFEQVSGYGEKSIVSQVENLLDIDLSIFQKTYHPDMEFVKNKSFDYWIETKTLIEKVDEFIEKSKKNKGYSAKILLNREHSLRAMLEMPYEELIAYQTKNPLSLYPPSKINEDELLESFFALRNILIEHQVNNVDEIRLVYA